jgi:hypothetical protein
MLQASIVSYISVSTLHEKKDRRGVNTDATTPAESVQAFPHGASLGRAEMCDALNKNITARFTVVWVRRSGRDRIVSSP